MQIVVVEVHPGSDCRVEQAAFRTGLVGSALRIEMRGLFSYQRFKGSKGSHRYSPAGEVRLSPLFAIVQNDRQTKNALACKNVCRYAIAMNSAKQLKKDIEAFCRKHSMSGSRFSKLAVDDPAFWHKFVRGRVPSLDTYDRITRFMATYRPDR